MYKTLILFYSNELGSEGLVLYRGILAISNLPSCHYYCKFWDYHLSSTANDV